MKRRKREGGGERALDRQRPFVSKLGAAFSSPTLTVIVKNVIWNPHSAVPLWNGALVYFQILNPCLAAVCDFPRVWSFLTSLPPAWRSTGPPPAAARRWSTLLSAGRFRLAVRRTQSPGLNRRERRERNPPQPQPPDFMRNPNYIGWCIYTQLWLSATCGGCLSVCVRARERQPFVFTHKQRVRVCISESVCWLYKLSKPGMK